MDVSRGKGVVFVAFFLMAARSSRVVGKGIAQGIDWGKSSKY